MNLMKMLNYDNIPFNFNHDNLDDTKIIRFVDILHKKHSYLLDTHPLQFTKT